MDPNAANGKKRSSTTQSQETLKYVAKTKAISMEVDTSVTNTKTAFSATN
jgi:hypothetical protein